MRFFNFSLLPFLLAATVSAYTPLLAEENKWRFTYEADGIKTYRRITEESKFFEFKAAGNLRGKISEFVSVIIDTDEHPNWVPRCIEARNIDKINDRELIMYAVFAGVWPIADRDYSARVSIASEPNIPTVRIDVERVELPDTPPIATNMVHIPHLKSYWIFEQISQDFTRVELHAHLDPGGWLPAWLVNWGYRKIPYQFLKNLEFQVAKRLSHTPTLANDSTIPH
jgi:hypothetical protein